MSDCTNRKGNDVGQKKKKKHPDGLDHEHVLHTVTVMTHWSWILILTGLPIINLFLESTKHIHGDLRELVQPGENLNTPGPSGA